MITKEIADIYYKHEKVINEKLNSYLTLFTQNFKGIDSSHIKRLFWKYIKDEKVQILNPLQHWYVKCVIFLYYVIGQDLLFIEKRIDKSTLDYYNQFTHYLFNRILPHIEKIDIDYLDKIAHNVPNENEEQIYQIINELLDMNKDFNLFFYLGDKENSTSSKIRYFKDEYSRYFEVFNNQIFELGNLFARLETVNKHTYGPSIYEIFQLNGNNIRTPPNLVKTGLINLIHIRNAINHSSRGGIVQISKDKIKISDKNNNGDITFEVEQPSHYLWVDYYFLLTSTKAIETMCRMVVIFKIIAEMNRNYTIQAQCYDCGKMNVVFFPPWRKFIKCKKCFKKLYRLNKPSKKFNE